MSILTRLIGGRRRRQPQPQTPSRPGTVFPPPRQPDPDALPFEIRPLVDSDLVSLPTLFRDSILGLADNDYDPEQLQAWVSHAGSPDFTEALTRGTTVVALQFGRPVAFAQLAPADYLNMLYVHPDAAGEGIATLLCQYLEDEARIAGTQQLLTHASKTAHRFFKTMGFVGDIPEDVKRNGEKLVRYRMEKKL
jgi:putative acetyltransferase